MFSIFINDLGAEYRRLLIKFADDMKLGASLTHKRISITYRKEWRLLRIGLTDTA